MVTSEIRFKTQKKKGVPKLNNLVQVTFYNSD